MPTVVLSTPACSILAISRGSADSDEDVERISRNSRARYLKSEKMLMPATVFSSRPRTTNTKSTQVA